MRMTLHYILGLMLAFYLIPISAWANAGAPMIFVTGPVLLVSLIPMIIVEAYVIKNYLDLSTKQAAIYSTAANLVSTLIGIPLTWFILVAIQILTGGTNAYGIQTFFQKFLAVTWQAPWLIPYEGNLGWMIPTAMLVLLVPFFFASWGIEYLVIKKIDNQLNPDTIKAACLRANFISYMLIALYPISLYYLK